jgi:mono/diheme cytochrome c family protein
LHDKSIDVVVQAIDSLRWVPAGAARPQIQATMAAYPGNEIITASAQQSLQFDAAHPGAITVKIDPVGMALMKGGRDHFSQICFACHGSDGKGVVTSDGMHLAPPLSGSSRVLGSPEALVRIVLNGLSGDIDGKSYPGQMVPQKANDDQWLAEVLTYIRNSFGNNAPTITTEQVAAIRKVAGDHVPYTLADLGPYLAVPRDAMAKWAISASDNEKEAKRAIDGDPATRWATGKPQQQGQWYQFDMGKPYLLTRLTMDATASKNDYPRKFEVCTSDDGEHWSKPVASGTGATVTTVDFPKNTVTRYVRIVQTASIKTGNFWSIHELSVYGAAADTVAANGSQRAALDAK